MKLALELDSDRVAPGELLAGRIVVVEGGTSRSLTLTVSFNEQARGYGATPSSSSSVLHEGDLAAGQSIDFSFTLPVEALPSVKSEHAELYWEVDVQSDERGPDTHVRRRFEVVAG